MADLLTSGATAAVSAELVVAAGSAITVGLKGAAGDNAPMNARIDIELKGDGLWYNVGELSRAEGAVTAIVAPGTYRFNRPAGPVCGVFQA